MEQLKLLLIFRFYTSRLIPLLLATLYHPSECHLLNTLKSQLKYVHAIFWKGRTHKIEKKCVVSIAAHRNTFLPISCSGNKEKVNFVNWAFIEDNSIASLTVIWMPFIFCYFKLWIINNKHMNWFAFAVKFKTQL